MYHTLAQSVLMKKIDQLMKTLTIIGDQRPSLEISYHLPAADAKRLADTISQITGAPYVLGGTDSGNWYNFYLGEGIEITIYKEGI